tara:strand:- start:1134 stop:1358 length:225 start_codon:yes stop_codon:yes gene_type:complete
MRIAKTIEDLPTGTPIEIYGRRTYRGLVIKAGWSYPYRQDYIKVLFSDGSDIIYYEEDIEEEGIRIVEVIDENR